MLELEMSNFDAEVLKRELVVGITKNPSFGGKSDINEHVQMLESEFVGEPKILLYHAILIVLIRRKIELPANIAKFNELWQSESEFLICHLNTRWLVSACDTFVDYGNDPTERAFALAGTLFSNTLKIYETERWATGVIESAPTYREVTERVDLFDGMTAFVIGKGDMIHNLCNRATSLTSTGGKCASILSELLRRASLHDTAFFRFKKAHSNAATAW